MKTMGVYFEMNNLPESQVRLVLKAELAEGQP